MHARGAGTVKIPFARIACATPPFPCCARSLRLAALARSGSLRSPERASAAGEPTPKPNAQERNHLQLDAWKRTYKGCEGRATLGQSWQHEPTPTGLRPRVASPATTRRQLRCRLSGLGLRG